MKIILIAFIIFCTHSLGLCVECPEGFVDLEGRCYYFSKETAAWLEASRKCTEMEASLLAIETEKEAMLVFKQAVKLNVNNNEIGYWTSGLLTKVSNVQKPAFVWTSTWEHFTYTAWCNGEPNNWDNDEYCVHLTTLQRHNSRACWNDRGCVHSTTHRKAPMYYICETEELSSVAECEECAKCNDCTAGGYKVDNEDDKIAYEISIHEI